MIKLSRLFLIVLLLGMLIVPLLNVNKADISEQENRKLATFPEMIKQGHLNYTFGQEFEHWLGDRFWGRELLQEVSVYLQYMLVPKYQRNEIVKGKNGWLFQVKPDILNLTQEQGSALERFQNYCRTRDIHLIMLFYPASSDVYTDFYPLDKERTLSPETIHFMKTLNLIFPLKTFQEHKDEYHVYFKTDHHWSDYGAALAYQDTVPRLQKLYPKYPKFNQNDFETYWSEQQNVLRPSSTVDSLCKVLGLNHFGCSRDTYLFYKNKATLQQQNIPGKWTWGVTRYVNEQGYPIKVLLLGTSYTIAYQIFLSQYVREVIQVDMNSLYPDEPPSVEPYLDVIEREKPNVIILLMNYRNFSKDFKDE